MKNDKRLDAKIKNLNKYTPIFALFFTLTLPLIARAQNCSLSSNSDIICTEPDGATHTINTGLGDQSTLGLDNSTLGGNSGYSNQGNNNTGAGNSGSGNYGIANSGSGNYGIANSGSGNYGIANSGSGDYGLSNGDSGSPSFGAYNSGSGDIGAFNQQNGKIGVFDNSPSEAENRTGISAAENGIWSEIWGIWNECSDQLGGNYVSCNSGSCLNSFLCDIGVSNSGGCNGSTICDTGVGNSEGCDGNVIVCGIGVGNSGYCFNSFVCDIGVGNSNVCYNYIICDIGVGNSGSCPNYIVCDIGVGNSGGSGICNSGSGNIADGGIAGEGWIGVNDNCFGAILRTVVDEIDPQAFSILSIISPLSDDLVDYPLSTLNQWYQDFLSNMNGEVISSPWYIQTIWNTLSPSVPPSTPTDASQASAGVLQ